MHELRNMRIAKVDVGGGFILNASIGGKCGLQRVSMQLLVSQRLLVEKKQV
jgi:hypothetical protein